MQNWSVIILYLLPYGLSLAISLGVAAYTWQHRHVNGAAYFTAMVMAQASWTFGYIFELASPTLDGKIFWDNFQFIGAVAWPLTLLAFAMTYTGRKLRHPTLFWLLVSAIPIYVLLAVFTHRWHDFARTDAWLVPGQPFDALIYDFTPLIQLGFLHILVLFLAAIALLASSNLRQHRLYQRQTNIIILGTLVPLIGITLTMLNMVPAFHRDTTPLTFAVSHLLIAWGLFRYRLFDIVPAAREIVVESMEDGVIVVDAENRLVDLNPAASRFTGVPLAESAGKPIAEVFPLWQALVEPHQTGDRVQTEIRLPRPDRDYYMALQIATLYNRQNSSLGRVYVLRDITPQKEAARQLRQKNEELEEINGRLATMNETLQKLNQVKDEFVANVSHELRSPITSLKLHTDLIERRPERTHAYLDSFRREVDRLGDLIESLLALSRLDQNGVDLDSIKFDLNRLIEEYVTDRHLLATTQSLSLDFQPRANPCLVEADKQLIGQVFSILLTNALNYTPAGGHITVWTEVQVAGTGQLAGFSVSDTGPGIAPAEQSQLFTRFFRGKTGYDSKTAGTGLGLALAQEIVKRHNGYITVESSGIVGQGAMFTVWLPAHKFFPE